MPRRSGARALLGAFDIFAVAVFTARDPDFQRRALAACDCGDDDAQRRITQVRPR